MRKLASGHGPHGLLNAKESPHSLFECLGPYEGRYKQEPLLPVVQLVGMEGISSQRQEKDRPRTVVFCRSYMAAYIPQWPSARHLNGWAPSMLDVFAV